MILRPQNASWESSVGCEHHLGRLDQECVVHALGTRKSERYGGEPRS
jgi:hypothetical protein